MKDYSLIDAIGNTPLVKINKFYEKEEISVYAKLESLNPGGSIKDRTALYMIEAAEKRKELFPGKTILEATSGNMGIALSMIGAVKGYRVTIVMSDAMSCERKSIIRAFGAELILTEKKTGTMGALRKAREIAVKYPEKFWFADQFSNPDNVLSHYHGIADEILRSLKGIDYLVTGIGTSGTVSGVSRRFREKSPKTKIVGVVPEGGYRIQGLQNPVYDFRGDIYSENAVDFLVKVSEEEAYKSAKEAAKKEGLLVGISSGAVLNAVKKFGRIKKNNTIVVILPDSGEKYLSTGLFVPDKADTF